MAQYRAVAFRQSANAPQVVLFAAPATDIDSWAGVPQRELLDGQETIGFQREDNTTRVNQLKRFLDDERNVVQNPILCAARNVSNVIFHADHGQEDGIITGTIEISEPDFSEYNLLELFSELESQLRARQPALSDATVEKSRVMALQRRLQEDPEEEVIAGENEEEDSPVEQDVDSIGGLFAKETHILEFWQEIKARKTLLEELPNADSYKEEDSFLGFSREVLESYLRPVFLVDGQHRLRGAVESARDAASNALFSGNEDDVVPSEQELEEIARRYARVMPISLLLQEDMAEHVFQFVVVNQKATPVGKALLGTIVASSLTEGELDQVASRLEQVGIKVTDSQAVSWFTRSKSSPFYGLVQQGMTGEGSDKLPWSVLRDLISVFRNLQGGRLFHESPPVDYADIWKRQQLLESALIKAEIDPEEEDALEKAYTYWQALDGPWVGICSAFFWAIRSRLSDSVNPTADNGWGSTKSNIYNKVTLWILVSDFFQFLTDRGLTLDSQKDVEERVEEWLRRVDKAYFARDWDLRGIKKDTPGIRAQWSALWVAYRKDPGDLRRIKASEFRKARK